MVGEKFILGIALEAISSLFPIAGEAQPGTYPNLSGAGTHGNPAAFTPDKEWVGVGGLSSEGKLNTVSATASREIEDVQLRAGLVQVPGKQATATANVAIRLGHGLALGAGGGAGKGSAGAVGTFTGENTLARGSFEFDFASNSTFAGEIRRRIRNDIELTLSGKKAFDRNGKSAFEGVGMQAKKGGNVVSFGAGGKSWKDFAVAYRRIAGPIRIDAAYKKVRGQKPQVSVTVIRAFNLGGK